MLHAQSRNRRLAGEVQALQQAAAAKDASLVEAQAQLQELSAKLQERQALVEQLEGDLLRTWVSLSQTKSPCGVLFGGN
jgi:chromosome segregation ATPase